MKSSEEPNNILLDLYTETYEKEHLDHWYSSEGAIIQAMRLANHTATSALYSSIIGLYGGDKKYANNHDMVNPDLLTYAYEAIGELLYTWDPSKSKLSTYVYNYGPSRLMRIRGRDLREESLEYEDFSNYQDVVEDYSSYNTTKKEASRKLQLLEQRIEERGTYQHQLVLQVLMGKIAQEKAIEEMGIDKDNYWYYKKQTFELIKNDREELI